jgi:hypothetical protein
MTIDNQPHRFSSNNYRATTYDDFRDIIDFFHGTIKQRKQMTDYNKLYDDITSKLTITGDNGERYLSLLAHNDLKKIILGLTNKEMAALIKFLKMYRGHAK